MSQRARDANDNLPEGVHLTSDLTVLMATAMALGTNATSYIPQILKLIRRYEGAVCTNIHQTVKEEYSGNDPHPYFATTNTTISFDFYDVEELLESPFAPPPGVSVEETARALLIGQLPASLRGIGPPQSPPPSSAQSAISISSSDSDSDMFGNTSDTTTANLAASAHVCQCSHPT